ncbi:MAG TPA: DUF6799 domain-containing protein [Chitinophagales bacterium]|nr:DUF6799 domain-containing protein [Chitinophagales bacterium]
MKSLFVALTALFFFVNAQAQTTNTKTQTKTTKTQTTGKAKGHVNKDYFKMSEAGMMMAVKGGVTTTMSVDVMLKNGIVIKSDGNVIMKDGKKIKLAAGQSIDARGKITTVTTTTKTKTKTK